MAVGDAPVAEPDGWWQPAAGWPLGGRWVAMGGANSLAPLSGFFFFFFFFFFPPLLLLLLLLSSALSFRRPFDLRNSISLLSEYLLFIIYHFFVCVCVCVCVCVVCCFCSFFFPFLSFISIYLFFSIVWFFSFPLDCFFYSSAVDVRLFRSRG